VYVSTDVFADALRPTSPTASCDLVLTVDDGGIAEVARDYEGGEVLHCARRLIHAVVNSDAGSFATAAAALTRAAVMVLDGDGALIASSDKPGPGRRDVSSEPAGDSRDILLHDESGLWGAVRLINTPPVTAGTEGMLRDLGLTLVKSIRADRRRTTLESQLIVLSCLAGEDSERLFRRDGEGYSGIVRRLVVLRAATAIDGHAGARLKDAIRSIGAAASRLRVHERRMVGGSSWGSSAPSSSARRARRSTARRRSAESCILPPGLGVPPPVMVLQNTY
jgi:hypothetical protein